MKKMQLFFSLVTCLLFAQTVSADAMDQGMNRNAGAWNQVEQSDISNTQGQAYYGNQGQQQAAPIVDPATAPQGWERDAGNGYTCCCSYKPCHYTTCETVYVPQYNYKKCCRYVPQQYQVQRCRYVPQYYCETCCRQVPQYYTTCDCTQCAKQVYHQHCRYEPCYTYRCNPQPCCEPAPACAPAAPACNVCQ